MKTKPNSTSPMQRAGTIAAAAVATLLGLPVNAATTTFPQYPLMTGGSTIPPNILLILDDSGSMAYLKMPVDETTLEDDVSDRSYINNTIYYNPAITYRPWRTANTDLNDRLPVANFKAAASNRTSSTDDPVDLRTATAEDENGNDVPESYFYVPKSGISNPGTTSGNYDKYRIASSTSSTSYGGGVVQKRDRMTVIESTTIGSIASRTWSECVVVNTGDAENVTIQTSGGSGDGDLYVYYKSGDCSGDYRKSENNKNDESVTINSPRATISFRIFGYKNTTNISYVVTGIGWVDMTPSGNTSALQQAELQNFANWYQYHRTRNKMAKAGASEAFGRLGKNYRVGFDTIWNRGGAIRDPSGSTPALPIAYLTDGGLFQDANRSNFYSRLHNADARSGTPLHGALQRAGRYFGTENPWKDGNGSKITCRQNYAILTTDGYWNEYDGYTNDVGNGKSIGNADGDAGWAYGDTYSQTLADVAYYYWKNDLLPNDDDDVRPSAADPADWQHMVTFGVSIGLKGKLDTNAPFPPNNPVQWDEPGPNKTAANIDDLWHAAVNGHGTFVIASDTDRFAQALSDALKAIDGRTASGSNIASSSTKTDTTTLTFVAGFTSSTWLGDLIASPFNDALTGVSSTPTWVLSKTFGSTGVNAAFSDRTILTSKGGTAKLFTVAAFTSDTDFAVRSGQGDAVTAAENVAYLRGDQGKEIGKTNGTLRKRVHPVGDIVDSSPAYVAGTNTVYIGANDGMLHGIDASNGKVLFSYMPKGLDYAALANLSSTSYDHLRISWTGRSTLHGSTATAATTRTCLWARWGVVAEGYSRWT